MCSCSFDLIEIRVIEEPEGEDISDGGLVDKGGERERPCSGGSGFQQSVLSTLCVIDVVKHGFMGIEGPSIDVHLSSKWINQLSEISNIFIVFFCRVQIYSLVVVIILYLKCNVHNCPHRHQGMENFMS